MGWEGGVNSNVFQSSSKEDRLPRAVGHQCAQGWGAGPAPWFRREFSSAGKCSISLERKTETYKREFLEVQNDCQHKNLTKGLQYKEMFYYFFCCYYSAGKRKTSDRKNKTKSFAIQLTKQRK